MHTMERLPKEVEALEIIGGMCSDYALGQVRVCPVCKTYYLYFRDHDSESGTGYGYTDESIERISVDRVKDVIEKNIKVLNDIVERLQHELENPRLKVIRDITLKRLNEDQCELERLKKHLESLGE